MQSTVFGEVVGLLYCAKDKRGEEYIGYWGCSFVFWMDLDLCNVNMGVPEIADGACVDLHRKAKENH